MSVFRLVASLAAVALSMFFAEITWAQGCTAQRGCPTIPPSIPGSVSASRSPAAFLSNNFYASADANFDSRPSAPAAASDAPANKALIRISVPMEDAVVSFQGVASRQQGKQRLFASPALTAGREYRYVVRCVWNDGDRRVAREQSVLVRPGEETTVDFVASR